MKKISEVLNSNGLGNIFAFITIILSAYTIIVARQANKNASEANEKANLIIKNYETQKNNIQSIEKLLNQYKADGDINVDNSLDKEDKSKHQKNVAPSATTLNATQY